MYAWFRGTNRSWDGEAGEGEVDVLLPGADVVDPVHVEIHSGRLFMGRKTFKETIGDNKDITK